MFAADVGMATIYPSSHQMISREGLFTAGINNPLQAIITGNFLQFYPSLQSFIVPSGARMCIELVVIIVLKPDEVITVLIDFFKPGGFLEADQTVLDAVELPSGTFDRRIAKDYSP